MQVCACVLVFKQSQILSKTVSFNETLLQLQTANRSNIMLPSKKVSLVTVERLLFVY